MALAVFTLGLLAVRSGRGQDEVSLPGAAVLLGVVACAALVARRRWPLPVFAISTGGALLSMGAAEGRSPFVLAVVVALYTVAVLTERTTAVVAAGAAGLLLTAAAALSDGLWWPEPRTFAIAAWLAMGAALGDAVRTRRAYLVSLEERAARAEQTREQEARRRVAEERLRIARELHDAVAHHIAVVNVQAAVASHLLTSRPTAAEEALWHIRQAARTVLDELGAMLSVLRGPDDLSDPTEPAPGLAQVPGLVESFAVSGLQITHSVTGQPRSLPPSVDLVAFRIVREALTNAHKHGAGDAHVSLTHSPAVLRIEVTNRHLPERSVEADGAGHGLLGMQERATAVGGTCTAGPQDSGRFLVRAELPAAAPVPLS